MAKNIIMNGAMYCCRGCAIKDNSEKYHNDYIEVDEDDYDRVAYPDDPSDTEYYNPNYDRESEGSLFGAICAREECENMYAGY